MQEAHVVQEEEGVLAVRLEHAHEVREQRAVRPRPRHVAEARQTRQRDAARPSERRDLQHRTELRTVTVSTPLFNSQQEIPEQQFEKCTDNRKAPTPQEVYLRR